MDDYRNLLERVTQKMERERVDLLERELRALVATGVRLEDVQLQELPTLGETRLVYRGKVVATFKLNITEVVTP